MRRVECWVCGEPVERVSDEELRQALAEHFEEEHGQRPESGEIYQWVARKAVYREVREFNVGFTGRVLAGAAAVSFVLLALLRPDEPRTAEILLYGGFAALAGALVCALALLERLLQR